MAEQPRFKYDVFISYSSKDKDWVRRELLPRLEQTGLKACIDYRDFEMGALSIDECQRGVLESRKTLVVLTPDYLESGWTEIENAMLQTLDPANRERRFLPLMRRKCEVPLRIKTLTYANFQEEVDQDLAWRKLFDALGEPIDQEVSAPLPEAHPAGWRLVHPYLMPPHFTGRVAEREMLTRWLNGNEAERLLVLRALGGFGKSALAWHWLTHDVQPADWPRVVWWSFYETSAGFDSFVAETLHYLSGGKLNARELSPKGAMLELIGLLREPGTLLVLDGFERELRAFSGMNAAYQGDEAQDNDRGCVSPIAEDFLRHVAALPGLQSKVLMTTRLRPQILEVSRDIVEGCREEELKEIKSDDAVAFFEAQKIRGARVEIASACEKYGFHPLSLRLLAGWIVNDLRQPRDIGTAERLDVSGDLKQRKNHVLQVACDSLTPERQRLLSRIACFRSPVRYEVLRSVAEKAAEPVETLDDNLHDLIGRGLLQRDTNVGRFDLHPIVRRYAYERLTGSDRTEAHTELRDYFEGVPKPGKATCLEDLEPVIELYHHLVGAGQYDEAFALFKGRIGRATLYQLGAYELRIDLLRGLFPDGEGAPPRLNDGADQAWVLNGLGIAYSHSGHSRRAMALKERSNAIDEERGSKRNIAVGLSNLSLDQMKVGLLRVADTSLRRAIALSRDVEDEHLEGTNQYGWGLLLGYRGVFAESETAIASALSFKEKENRIQSQGVVWSYRAICELLRVRQSSSSSASVKDPKSAIQSARRAMELADETARSEYPHERDYIRAYWLLGAAYRVNEQYDNAEQHLNTALGRCRRINLVDHEADILIDLARLRAATGQTEDAKRLAEEALIITERCEYVLQGADARLELAKLALEARDKETALEHARKARELATCDGPPDYTYKVAYDEAGALLEQLT